MPVEVGIALPEESVSWTMLSVPWGMKQDSADRPPRYLPAPPESVISFLYKNRTGKLCSVCSTFGSLQIGVRACPPVEMPLACENALIGPPIGSSFRYPYRSPHSLMSRKMVSVPWPGATVVI